MDRQAMLDRIAALSGVDVTGMFDHAATEELRGFLASAEKTAAAHAGKGHLAAVWDAAETRPVEPQAAP